MTDIAELRKQAEAGSVVAQGVLGICYLHGIGTSVDYKQAVRWLSASAEKGVARSMAELGRMYFEGRGVAKNLAQAIPLLHRAAIRGDFSAQVDMARAYLRGEGVPADAKTALNWYKAAASQEGSAAIKAEELREAQVYLSRHKAAPAKS
jgi:TPR repeat protein